MKTPRTDAESEKRRVYDYAIADYADIAIVPACFARQLEIELIAANKSADFHAAQSARCDELRVKGERANGRLREALETAEKESNNGIPFYAYGDNEAAVEMADKLYRVNQQARAALAGEDKTP